MHVAQDHTLNKGGLNRDFLLVGWSLSLGHKAGFGTRDTKAAAGPTTYEME